MSNIQTVRNALCSEVTKTYMCTVKEYKDDKLKNDIQADHLDEWSAVYTFFNEHEQIQYVGRAIREVWIRLGNHISLSQESKESNLKDAITDSWIILVFLFPPAPYGSYENYIKQKFNPPFNKG